MEHVSTTKDCRHAAALVNETSFAILLVRLSRWPDEASAMVLDGECPDCGSLNIEEHTPREGVHTCRDCGAWTDDSGKVIIQGTCPHCLTTLHLPADRTGPVVRMLDLLGLNQYGATHNLEAKR